MNQNLISGNAVDSQNFMDSWLGKSNKGREFLLEESYTYGLRMGNWKYIKPKDNPVPNWIVQKFVDPGFRKEVQLFNLDEDPSESNNVYKSHPEIVEQMERKLEKILNP